MTGVSEQRPRAAIERNELQVAIEVEIAVAGPIEEMGVLALSGRRGRRSAGEPRGRHEIKCLGSFLLDRR